MRRDQILDGNGILWSLQAALHLDAVLGFVAIALVEILRFESGDVHQLRVLVSMIQMLLLQRKRLAQSCNGTKRLHRYYRLLLVAISVSRVLIWKRGERLPLIVVVVHSKQLLGLNDELLVLLQETDRTDCCGIAATVRGLTRPGVAASVGRRLLLFARVSLR